MVGWLVALRICGALVVFQPYRDLEAADNQSLKFKWRGGESNPGPLSTASQELNHSATAAPQKATSKKLKAISKKQLSLRTGFP